MKRITVVQAGEKDRLLEAREGENLWRLLQKNGCHLPAPCGGNGRCGKCRLRLLEGNDHVASATEKELLRPEELAEGWRLACCVEVQQDMKAELPNEEARMTILTDGVGRAGSEAKPFVQRLRRLSLRLPPPSVADQRSDVERLMDGLSAALHPAEADELWEAMRRLGAVPAALPPRPASR